MIHAGASAPDFELPDQDGNPVSLSALRGRPVVVYFYPKAERNASKGSSSLFLSSEPGRGELLVQ
jgi:peroxiredoxin